MRDQKEWAHLLHLLDAHNEPLTQALNHFISCAGRQCADDMQAVINACMMASIRPSVLELAGSWTTAYGLQQTRPVCLALQAFALGLLAREPWYRKQDWRQEPFLQARSPENTVVFLISLAQLVMLALVFDSQSPHRKVCSPFIF